MLLDAVTKIKDLLLAYVRYRTGLFNICPKTTEYNRILELHDSIPAHYFRIGSK